MFDCNGWVVVVENGDKFDKVAWVIGPDTENIFKVVEVECGFEGAFCGLEEEVGTLILFRGPGNARSFPSASIQPHSQEDQVSLMGRESGATDGDDHFFRSGPFANRPPRRKP